MSIGLYTEDALVQKTTADYLEQHLGWQSVYAYNAEDFGPGGLLGRNSDREVVLTRPLRSKLIELNPGLPDAAYDEAVRQIAATSAAQTLSATNREKYALIRDGVPVAFRNHKDERVRQRLRVLDFAEPANNDFLCVRELWIKGDIYRRRADIVGFVNGLPLLFMELKNVSKEIRAAYEMNFKDYKDTVPHLFHHNAFVILANGIDAKIGSVTSRFEHFHDWKRLAEDAPGVVDMETLLKGVCDKTHFMDLLENFILFDDSAGEPKKILARNHQFLGVNRAVDAVRDRQRRDGKLGVFWHTQGAGKSYSMVLFTRKVHRKLGGNFTFLVLTDRDDLDTQIYKTFAGCGVADNDRDPCRAASGDHLKRLLGRRKSHIFSLIQKFHRDVTPDNPYTLRDDVIVITDEAHRTQYGTLALNMRNALPNASYIGFTGTPLFKDDQITRRVFGDYISTYDFQRAVEDKATVPLYYDARGDKLGVAIGDINERIAQKLEELESGDIDVTQRLEAELKRDYHIITADKRLDQVARDFVNHYSTSWETGKAMLVCIDKITCVRMHEKIVKYWDQRIAGLEAELKFPPAGQDEQDAQYRRRQIDWMREARAAVVVSEEQGEVDKFRKWNLEIQSHRKLIKEGMDLPEAMRQQPQYRNMQRLALDDAFKAEAHPFRIAIVCAMWLTGFDVPCLATLYLDKPLKAHTLMQAIARANRILEGKNNGMIVDYCGILKNLRKALATFAGTGDGGRGGEGAETDPTRPDVELLADLYEAIALVRAFLRADISGILRQLHKISDKSDPYDISRIDFDRLRKEFERSPRKRTTVQNLKQAIEDRLQRLLRQNPLRTDFQRHYEEIVADYNREKDRGAIEQTFEDLLRFVDEMNDEESRSVREGLDEESLAVFDLLKKPDLSAKEIEQIKSVAVHRLQTLKAEKLRIQHWRDKEATRDAVRLAIRDFLWDDATGLPVARYTEDDVQARAEDVYAHVFHAYPSVPSPYYQAQATA